MREYYEDVLKDLGTLDGNEGAESHFFIDTEPNGEQPTGSRAMDVDKAAAIAAEFLHNCLKSVMYNANRVWTPLPTATLYSPDALEQPLSYYHPKEDELQSY